MEPTGTKKSEKVLILNDDNNFLFIDNEALNNKRIENMTFLSQKISKYSKCTTKITEKTGKIFIDDKCNKKVIVLSDEGNWEQLQNTSYERPCTGCGMIIVCSDRYKSVYGGTLCPECCGCLFSLFANK